LLQNLKSSYIKQSTKGNLVGKRRNHVSGSNRVQVHDDLKSKKKSHTLQLPGMKSTWCVISRVTLLITRWCWEGSVLRDPFMPPPYFFLVISPPASNDNNHPRQFTLYLQSGAAESRIRDSRAADLHFQSLLRSCCLPPAATRMFLHLPQSGASFYSKILSPQDIA